ncbi:leader peptidase (prepilin peptidase) / N-methyltransferase [Paramicrobacterium humi]|uniref:Leader peptidase (Prepilin peptidase) / N-methyltransferase n=1 Tax=Paramicrobacterium humi TaxID=640635 RepID=A0A1H4IM37_9MICO|nr:A24 family peptidase [Microbacterium humi]SEB35184.1 leader peptidase (prepilin peptidase) / N-methyltransferase [Microbacterium humi]
MADTSVRSRNAAGLAPTIAFGAALVIVAVAAVGWNPQLLGLTAIALVTWPLAVTDIAEHRLPNRLVLPCYPAALAGVLLETVLTGRSPLPALVGMVACVTGFIVLHVLGGMGMGDVKLAGVLGLCLGGLGPSALPAGLLAAFVLGGAAGAWAMATQHRASTHRIPFGPFLLAGLWLGVVAAGWERAL